MKNLYYVLTALLLSMGLYAQQQPLHLPKFVWYHDQLMQQPAIQQSTDGSRATVYKCIADRREVYNNPTSTWQFSDSTSFTYTPQVWPYTTGTFYHNGAAWAPGWRYTYTYNTQGQPIAYTTEQWINHLGIYRNYYKTTYTYNAAGSNTEELTQSWDTSSATWINYARNLRTFNAQNQLTELTNQDWNAGTTTWDNYYRQTGQTYDANNNLLTAIDQYWNFGAWVNSSKQINAYNTQNKVTAYTFQNWDGMALNWVNANRTDYFYDVNDNNNQLQYFSWNSGTPGWEITGRTNITYNTAHKPLLRTYETFSMGSYQYVEKYDYAYNAYNNQTYMEYFNWDGFTFKPQTRYTSTYDANQSLTLQLTENYNNGNLTYEPYSRRFYFYEEFTVSAINELKNELNATLYPNPVTGGTQPAVNFSTTANAQLIINIYDAQGRLTVQQFTGATAGNNTLQVPAQTLTAGVYYVQLVNTTNHQSSVLKLVKE